MGLKDLFQPTTSSKYSRLQTSLAKNDMFMDFVSNESGSSSAAKVVIVVCDSIIDD